ncbi:MAG: hypothetical protein ABJP34_06170 [Erythrobacter sp.]
MLEPLMTSTSIIAGAALLGLTITVLAALRGWQDYLALRRREIDGHSGNDSSAGGSKIGAARIEMSDLKERIRKLEAIANGVDL